MDSDLTVLKTSLSDRAHALETYLRDLKADLGRTDKGFGDALDVCGAYTRGFVRQLDYDWAEATGREELHEALRASLKSFLKREQWIDQRFARSSQGDVPRALKTIARQQFRKLALVGYEPVLTVGPPDSFEAQRASLTEFLFEDFHAPLNSDDEELRSQGPKLSIFCAPYIEGTRVLWYPIVLGHEIAHIRIERGHDAQKREAIVEGWLATPEVSFSEAMDDMVAEAPQSSTLRIDLNEQIRAWATELICDLNAARLFGPAGLSAIAEFLSILESQSKSGLDTTTHPPLWVRLEVLFRFLESEGWDGRVMPAFASVWRAQMESPAGSQLDNRTKWAANMVTKPERIQEMIDLVKGWGGSYTAGENTSVIGSIASELLDGVPGATHVPTGAGQWSEVSIFDVVNATWAARQALDAKEAGQNVAIQGALIDSGSLDAQTKRIRLDSLASKAIDTVELSRLWDGDRGVIAPSQIKSGIPLAGKGKDCDAAMIGSVLSRNVLADRIGSDPPYPPGLRMIVTPLFQDSTQDAAVDLRLGPDFIVFRHSATTAFDPLAEEAPDPRSMQEQVHKGWGERFILHPGELVLASTLEYIVVPEDAAAQVLTRSSYGRLGLLTATAVQVQPGSRGCITLELVNQGETPIALSPGARVAQLMLWFLARPSKIEPGKYRFPVGPEFSKVSKDKDAEALQMLAQSATEPAEEPNVPLTVRLELPEPLAKNFEDVAESEGSLQLQDRRSEEVISRLGPAELGIGAAGIAVSIQILAATIQRWIQGNKPGIVIKLDGDDAVVRRDENLPPGLVVISDRNGVRMENLSVPAASASVIKQILQTIRQLGKES